MGAGREGTCVVIILVSCEPCCLAAEEPFPSPTLTLRDQGATGKLRPEWKAVCSQAVLRPCVLSASHSPFTPQGCQSESPHVRVEHWTEEAFPGAEARWVLEVLA